jgi:hypothetical protein
VFLPPWRGATFRFLCRHQKGLTASQVWGPDDSRAFLLERENGMGHPTGTGILQPPSHQRATRWTPAALTPPLAPPAKPASCHLSGMTSVQAGIALCENGAGPHRCQYDHDLHPYAQSRVGWRPRLGASRRPSRGCRITMVYASMLARPPVADPQRRWA